MMIILCFSSDYQQHQRLMSRNNLLWEEAEQRISSQMLMSEKCKRSTYIIDNSGTIEMTEQQVTSIYRIFQKSRAHWRVRTVLSIVATVVLAFVYLLWWTYAGVFRLRWFHSITQTTARIP